MAEITYVLDFERPGYNQDCKEETMHPVREKGKTQVWEQGAFKE